MDKQTSARRKILLLSTGGTIASTSEENGFEPTLGSDDILTRVEAGFPDCAFHAENLMCLDSSNMQPEHWQIIAGRIYKALEEFDGVIVTHGTDTMAYTAAALSFMLRNLKKSVILTGSQVPIGETLSDAVNNLQIAIEAIRSSVTGVTVAFGHKVINGVRAVKTSTMSFDAFSSINSPPVGIVRADGLHINRGEAIPFDAEKPTTLETELSTDVCLLKLIPGTKPELFGALGGLGYRGIVLETFGAGGIHSEIRDLPAKIRQLTKSGISIVACSQCLFDGVNLSVYEVGKQLLDSGVIPAGDMTSESAVVKLMWALGKTSDPSEIKEIFKTNYAGEIRSCA